MKSAIFLLGVALVSANAQIGNLKQNPPAAVAAKPAGIVVTSEKPAVGLQTLGALEREMDGRLSATGAAINDPSILLGNTRGLYIGGFGAVFTSEVDLVNTPSMGLFPTPISAEQKVSLHKRKVAHVQLMQQTVRDMVLALAASPALKLSDTDQIVVSVRLVYRPWEDMTNLPGQIVMRLDRRGGVPRLEIQ